MTKINKSRLREIGWSLWDPLGLLLEGEQWDDENNVMADEYDSYLMNAAGQLYNGKKPKEVEDYLLQVEVELMGVRNNGTARQRVAAVVSALASDDALWVDE